MAPKELDPEVLRRIYPRDYLKRFVDNDARPDARTPSTARKLTMTTGSVNTAVGSAMVKLGRTTCVAGVQATLIPPPAGAPPDEGVFDIVADILPTAGPHVGMQRHSEDALVLTHYLRRWLDPVVDRAKLCVRPAELVWLLRISVYCIDNDGNMHDVAALAAVAALRDVRLPIVSMLDDVAEEDAKKTTAVDKDHDAMTDADVTDRAIAIASAERIIALQIEDYPVVVSFALFDGKALIDPSAEEEDVADAKLMFVFNPKCELRSVLKPGGKTLSGPLYESCLSAAKARSALLIDKLINA